MSCTRRIPNLGYMHHIYSLNKGSFFFTFSIRFRDRVYYVVEVVGKKKKINGQGKNETGVPRHAPNIARRAVFQFTYAGSISFAKRLLGSLREGNKVKFEQPPLGDELIMRECSLSKVLEKPCF